MADLTIKELTSEAHAALGGICNRGYIFGGGNVLVIDAGIGLDEAMALRAAAQGQLGSNGHLSLFNTHSHGDHVFGNQVFADCPIIAQDAVRRVLIEQGQQTMDSWRQNPQMAPLIGDAKLTLPNVTFEERMSLFLGEQEIQLIRVGPAHSQGDAIVWLPRSRVLFAGDILFNDLIPAMPPGGNSAGWVRALETLEMLGPAIVVPGHGPLQPITAIGDLRSWIVGLRNRVADAILAGLDKDATIARVGPEMQQTAPRGREERLPIVVGQVFEDITRERAEEMRISR